MPADTGLLESFLAAIQASLSVLLVIVYGGMAAWLKLLNPANTKAISKVCVRMFLPALLLTKIGSELQVESAGRYLTILVWAIICHLVSFVVGIAAHLFLGMPDWTTIAVMFNNTTSYPLLLISALDDTGILKSLIVTDETTTEALERAKAYFLVFATVSSCLTFAIGPRLIDSEHAPEAEENNDKEPSVEAQREGGGEPDPTEQTRLLGAQSTVRFSDPFAEGSGSGRKPSVFRAKAPVDRRASIVPKEHWATLGPRAKWWLLFVSDFFNAPMLGALLGAVIGLVPRLHAAFFNDTEDGGIFTAWLTASLKSIGGLFVPLPVVVAGVSLYTSMREANGGNGSGGSHKLPWLAVTFVLLVRFVIWPVASIAVIYALASRTSILGPDPMLWFTMMLMPTGPPAMKLITLVQVSDSEPQEETNIAKLLTVSYLISPLLSLTVVASLRASQASIR